MKIKLNCLGCGHPIELGDAYADYEGEVRCWACGSMLEVGLRAGKLRSMHGRLGRAAESGRTTPEGRPASPAVFKPEVEDPELR